MNNTKETIKIITKELFNPDNKLALIPNWLSFSRAIGSYIIPVLIYTSAPVSTLFFVIFFIALSDFLDGKLARLFKTDSKEGALIDVISDKLFSINLILAILPKAPIFIINGILESTISYINAKSYSNGGNPESNLLGKIKIWPLSIALGLGYISIATSSHGIYFINPNIIVTLSNIFSVATIPLEIINIKQYQEAAKKEELHIKEIKRNKKNETKEIKEKEIKEKEENKKITLDKNSDIKIMIYELSKKQEKIKQKQKRL